MIKKLLILLTFAVLVSSCANQLDLREGDCSITRVEVDARAATPVLGGVEADGWMMVIRGKCTPDMIKLYRETMGVKERATAPISIPIGPN